MNSYSVFSILCIICNLARPVLSVENINCLDKNDFSEVAVNYFNETMIPDLQDKKKGEAGKICVIGGSTEYTGAPYFAAISALKTGADLVYIITTESAAPVIKAYSPDLIIYPFLSDLSLSVIESILSRMDVVVIGPGLGREADTVSLVYDIIDICRYLQKPLVIDADGIFAVSKNLSTIINYPYPGIILTPNAPEEKRLKAAISKEGNNDAEWYKYWGDNVYVLVKGQTDTFYGLQDWTLSEGGSGRRVAGQGDILAGILATFFNWAIKTNNCSSLPAYVAAKLTRACNENAFSLLGRSMIASDMLTQIPSTFKAMFE